MELKYHFNKTSQQQLAKELKVRIDALPTLHAKEAALRNEVKRAKEAVLKIESDIAQALEEVAPMEKLWAEFPRVLCIREVRLKSKNIAGVKIDELEGIDFDVKRFSLFGRPFWFMRGVDILRNIARMKVRLKVLTKELEVLDYARKKTTQKVNLYEKVQVPAYREAIRKIKRFLEDEDNLARSSQKILKERKAMAGAAS
ncbi:MAG: V-type ATP synthase subunit D [Deltaproteobacteria bacterium]|nr:V-type ATP synthase subunit D [Deltaproteobacteria bacterium]